MATVLMTRANVDHVEFANSAVALNGGHYRIFNGVDGIMIYFTNDSASRWYNKYVDSYLKSLRNHPEKGEEPTSDVTEVID